MASNRPSAFKTQGWMFVAWVAAGAFIVSALLKVAFGGHGPVETWSSVIFWTLFWSAFASGQMLRMSWISKRSAKRSGTQD